MVHRRARLPQVGGRRARRAGGGVRRGHRVRRLGDRGLRPRLRVRHGRPPGSVDVPGAARGRPGRATTTRRGCSATSRCPTARRPGRTRGTCCAARCRRPPRPGSPATSTPRSSSTSCATCPPTAARRCRPTTAATSTRPATTSPRTSGATRSRRSSRWASPSSSATTRAGPGQQEIDLRYADALTMADNIMTFRYVVKEVAITQGVRASFMPKPFSGAPRLGDAHALLALRGRPQRLPRPRRPLRALRDRQGVRGGRAAARAGDLRGHQPVGELLQAPDRRRRGAHRGLLGPRQPVRAGPGADVLARQVLHPPRGDPHPGHAPATRTWRSR